MTYGRWKSSRRALAALVASTALLLPLAGGALANDNPDGHDPSQWPAAPGVNPSLDGLANGIRYMGVDRYQTNFATVLSQTTGGTDEGGGDYPFTNSDRTNGNDNDSDLGNASFWGANGDSCAILVTAGDKFPDSLTAAALSEAGDNGDRVTARSLNDGDVNTIDTEDAPIVITRSTREGATGLSPTAAQAARYAWDETCVGNDEGDEAAIIVGGTSAVPTGVEGELQAIGYDVYRLGGLDRNDTARQIAFAINNEDEDGGSDSTNGTCDDSDSRDSADMVEYGIGAVELRQANNTCQVLNRTVFIADGITGADPLAVSWASAFSGAPVLLTNDSGLPNFTQSALQTQNYDNVVAIGGTARISDATLAQAGTLAGVPASNTFRVAGVDRYATSVEIAQRLGGWWAQTDADAERSIFSLASSGGQGDAGTGWPDALGAGPWSAVAHGYNDDPHSPFRASAPTNGNEAFEAGGHPGNDAVPILLTQTNTGTLPSSVATFLASIFPASEEWCDSNTGDDCDGNPGFVVAFGGTAAIPQGAFQQANTLVTGGQYTDFGDADPTVAPGFWTRLDMTPVFVSGENEPAGANKACYGPNSLQDVRWLSVYDNAAKTAFDTEYDVMMDGDVYDNDDNENVPVCVDDFTDTDSISHVFGVSLSGHFTPGATYDYSGDNRFDMSVAQVDTAADSAGGTSSDDPGTDGSPGTEGTTTTNTWSSGAGGTAHLPIGGTSGTDCGITSSALTLTITRNADNDAPADGASGAFTVTTSCGTVTGNVLGAAIFNGSGWFIRGTTVLTGGTSGVTAGGRGGFNADWTSGDDAINLNDGITWQSDALES